MSVQDSEVRAAGGTVKPVFLKALGFGAALFGGLYSFGSPPDLLARGLWVAGSIVMVVGILFHLSEILRSK